MPLNALYGYYVYDHINEVRTENPSVQRETIAWSRCARSPPLFLFFAGTADLSHRWLPGLFGLSSHHGLLLAPCVSRNLSHEDCKPQTGSTFVLLTFFGLVSRCCQEATLNSSLRRRPVSVVRPSLQRLTGQDQMTLEQTLHREGHAVTPMNVQLAMAISSMADGCISRQCRNSC